MFWHVRGYSIIHCSHCELTYAEVYEKDVEEAYGADYYRKVYPDYESDRVRHLANGERLFATFELLFSIGKMDEIGSAFGFFLDATRRRGLEYERIGNYEVRGASGLGEGDEPMTASKLKMEKMDLGDTPDVSLPEGYSLRCYRPGDEKAIARIYGLAKLGHGDVRMVREKLQSHPSFLPERVFVVVERCTVVGTAAAMIDRLDPSKGFLHMMAVHPDYRGLGLGKCLAVAAIRRGHEEGLKSQWLLTDDWRLAGVRIYAGLGYHPMLAGPDHERRWREIANRLGCPRLLELVHLEEKS